GEAGHTQALSRLGRRFDEALFRQITEGIGANVASYLFNGFPGSDQLPAVAHVDAEEAGVGNGRRRDAHMTFARPRLPQHLQQPPGRGRADDRVVDNDHSLTFEDLSQGVVLEVGALIADALVRHDKGAPDVAVLDDPFDERNTGLAGVANSG